MLSLLTPLIMGIMIYLITYNLEYKRVEKENILQLNQVMDKLNQGLIEADRLTLQLLTNDEVKELSGEANLLTSGEIYKAAEFLKKNSLIPKSLLNKLFAGYFIIEPESGLVFSQSLVSSIDSFWKYDYSMRDLDDAGFTALLGNLKYSGFYPELTVRESMEPHREFLPYFHVYRESKQSSRIVMVLIDPDSVEDLFSGAVGTNGSRSFNLLYKGTPVLTGIDSNFLPPDAAGGTFSVGMDKYKNRYLSYSEQQNWSCLFSQPVDSVSGNIQYIPKLTLFVILGIMVLSLVFLLFLAYQSSRPILFLLEKIRQEKDLTGTGKDAFSTLDFFMEQLKGRNHQLEEQIAEQKTKLKTNFLTSLLYDTIPNPSQIPTMARHAGLKITKDPYLTALVQLKGSETHLLQEWEQRFPISLISLQKIICETFGSQVYLIQISLNEICLLANLKGPSKVRERERLIQVLTGWVKNELQETYVIGISQFHYGWESVGRSFREARAALIYHWPGNDDMVNLYQKETSTGSDNDVYFPREMDHVILNALRTGHSGELKECLVRLRRENLEHRKLEPFSQNILISRYKEILTYAKSNLEIEDRVLQEKLGSLIREPAEQLSHFLTRTDELLLELCDYFFSDQTLKEHKIAEKVKEYLEANFQDNQLSLNMTAEHLGLSSQYLTRLVKKFYGKTFRNYMEDLRMEYVRKLITGTDEPIHLLIEQGGFNSMNTFCKAFKRKYGYKASSLRE